MVSAPFHLQNAKVDAAGEIAAPKILIAMLAIQVFCAFLTETKFIPTLANNVGAFELSAVFFVSATGVYFLKNNLPVRSHPVFLILGLFLPVAALSVLQIPSERIFNGIIALVILIFLFVLTLTMYNLVALKEKYLFYLLRTFVYSAVIVSIWVVIDSVASGGEIDANGPYRNRAQMGIISLTSLWVILIYSFFPSVPKLERILMLLLTPLPLYCVAVSGRRSVYLSIIVGLLLFALSSVAARGWGRVKVLTAVACLLGGVSLLYFVVGTSWKPLAFFEERIVMVQGRFESAVGTGDAAEDGIEDRQERFSRSQREGAYKALMANPLLGIGWGGFAGSVYSETRHEVHSTPIRFLAETGVLGFFIYLCFMGRILWGSVRVWLMTRRTIYHLSTHILCIALFSLTVSYLYNRQVTERTFWLLLVVFLAFETLIMRKANQQKQEMRLGHG